MIPVTNKINTLWDLILYKPSILLAAFFGFLLIFAVVVNFIEAGGRHRVEIGKKKEHIIATLSMSIYFICLFYIVTQFYIPLPTFSLSLYVALEIISIFLTCFGTMLNIWGRISLGKNWSDPIAVYQDQTLATHGAYAWVRHPLYAGLVLYGYGLALAYQSFFGIFIHWFIFAYAMKQRALAEEKMLLEKFPEYAEYTKNVGLFFPKIL